VRTLLRGPCNRRPVPRATRCSTLSVFDRRECSTALLDGFGFCGWRAKDCGQHLKRALRDHRSPKLWIGHARSCRLACVLLAFAGVICSWQSTFQPRRIGPAEFCSRRGADCARCSERRPFGASWIGEALTLGDAVLLQCVGLDTYINFCALGAASLALARASRQSSSPRPRHGRPAGKTRRSSTD
jgi:hypothetical protein